MCRMFSISYVLIFVAGQCFKQNGTIHRYEENVCKNHTKIGQGLYK